MRIAFTGAHRTGKTTLANELAKTYNIPYIDSDVRGYIASLGLTAQDTFSTKSRIEMQVGILHHLLNKVKQANKDHQHFVLDRCALDTVGYLLSELHQHSLRDADISPKMVLDLIETAERETFSESKLDLVILVRPAIKIQGSATSASDCPVFQAHVDRLIHSSFIGYEKPRTSMRHIVATVGLNERLAELTGFAQAYLLSE